MVQLNDIHPLTGFLRDHKTHIERLAATGRPEVLTVNGRAKVVIQDAESYQRMMDLLDSVEAVQIIQQRLAAIEGAEPGVPAARVLDNVRAKISKKR